MDKDMQSYEKKHEKILRGKATVRTSRFLYFNSNICVKYKCINLLSPRNV